MDIRDTLGGQIYDFNKAATKWQLNIVIAISNYAIFKKEYIKTYPL